VEDLAATGYDYWALGHVHTRDILRTRAPMVVYPGNTQGRHINEQGAKGVYVVSVADDGEIVADFEAIDVLRWVQIEAAIDDVEDEIELLDRIEAHVERAAANAEGRHVVYRLRMHGRGPVHASLAREGMVDELVGQLNASWATREPFAFCGGAVDETKSELDRAGLRRGSDFVADLLELSEQTAANDALVAELQEELAKLYRNPRLKRYLEDSLPTPEDIREILEYAEDLALDRLADD
jgi:DNA repair exonuclease SbcCD nuclease subunit